MHKRYAVTIMELMIVIAIVGILAAISYPSYNRIKMEARRTDAHSAIIAANGIVERYLVEHNKANIVTADMSTTALANYDVSSGTPVLSAGGYYVIQIVPDSTDYTIKATATVTGSTSECTVGSNAKVGQCPDLQCRIISLIDGAKQSTDNLGTVANASTTKCW